MQLDSLRRYLLWKCEVEDLYLFLHSLGLLTCSALQTDIDVLCAMLKPARSPLAAMAHTLFVMRFHALAHVAARKHS